MIRSLASDADLLERFDGPAARQWRRACGVGQVQLAALLGIHRSTVARFEGMPGPLPAWYTLAAASAERLFRADAARERDRLRHRVASRRRRKREREAQEATAAGYW